MLLFERALREERKDVMLQGIAALQRVVTTTARKVKG